MSNQRIIYKRDDGGVSIIIPAPAARNQFLLGEAVYETVIIPATENEPEREEQRLVTPATYRDETDDEFITRIALKDVPTGKPYKIVDAADIPTDRSQRNLWTVDETDLTDGAGA